MSVLGETPSVTSPGASEASQPVGMTADGVSPSALDEDQWFRRPQARQACVHTLLGWSSSSAPAAPSPGRTGPTQQPGVLLFHCAACLLEWEEPYCDICGANLTTSIDRPSHPTLSETVRGAEGDPC